jgi:hypothetical protein
MDCHFNNITSKKKKPYLGGESWFDTKKTPHVVLSQYVLNKIILNLKFTSIKVIFSMITFHCQHLCTIIKT